MAKPLLSFVIPCYRSANTIGAVVRELNDTLATRADEYDHEIILVNDGSPDDTADAIRQLCERDPAIVFVDLSRNFGQHSAVMAGFHQVRGDIVICLDDDGQTPACECFKLIDKVAEGYDIVFAQYPRRRQSALRNLGSRFNAACNHYFFGQPKELTVNSYYACRRFVVDTALQYPNPFPYVTGLLFQSVSRYANVPVEHRARTEGRSGYNLKKLVALWLNGVTAFSIKPLRFASYAGWFTAVAGAVFALATVIRKLVNPDIRVLGIFMTAVETGSSLDREMIANFPAMLPSLAFQTYIRKNIDVKKAPLALQPLCFFSPRCTATADYAALCDEMLARMEG